MRRGPAHGYSVRELQSILGVSRRVLSGVIDSGLVVPTRGHRNELRFSFRDVVVLRTALQLRTSNVPARKILRALARLKQNLPSTTPLSGLQISAVGDAIAVRSGETQWDATSGQLLLDFGDTPTKNAVSQMEASPARLQERARQAADWYAKAEQLQERDPVAAEHAYRKVIELSPQPHYHAYNNLGAMLSGSDDRCAEALVVFEQALKHFNDAELLHYNRSVLLEHAGRLEEAARGYMRCLELNPHSEDAAFSHGAVLEQLGEYDDAANAYVRCLQINPSHAEARRHLESLIDRLRGDGRALIRHLSAWRRSTV
ncbi:MerR family transcriptional regulator [Paraburkholderia tropica]|uniref:MerR family transcriptional regulator n=1 Tax=Paraburkholderia tropica TaxID=92647 RepID=UPI003D2DCBD1